ncbi:RNA ligase family protein [Glycomyces tenuis]|uniref:RNA ligase family protein n=1 Tax=Glycomyces tenuis TaxID=58116 RepID=UPI0004129A2C|nr:RNA ligase family protein [Glycomyces tenuis]
MNTLRLEAIDTATKYPSIPTWHQMGDKGILTETTTVAFEPGEPIYLTEKIDGTNARIIALPDGDWLLGSRKQLLAARGDRVPNQGSEAQVVIAALATAAETIAAGWNGPGVLAVYCEVYGAGIGRAWRNYTANRHHAGVRVFDAAQIDPAVFEWDTARIAAWRDGGGQDFGPDSAEAIRDAGIEPVPDLGGIDGADLPAAIEPTAQWLRARLRQSRAVLDEGGAARPEGIVARGADRSKIVKLRFADYAATLRQQRR